MTGQPGPRSKNQRVSSISRKIHQGRVKGHGPKKMRKNVRTSQHAEKFVEPKGHWTGQQGSVVIEPDNMKVELSDSEAHLA